MTGEFRKPSDIEADIARERAKLSHDLETLQDRLTVEGLMDEVRVQVRSQIDEVAMQARSQLNAVAGDVAATLRDQIGVASHVVSRTARRNPWPFAVVGLGLAWMAISAVTPDRSTRKKPRIGMAPIKATPDPAAAAYDYSPADIAAAHLDDDAGTARHAQPDAGSRPIPPYDPEPSWARDDDALTLSRP